MNCLILKSVRIGIGSIIGAGSIITSYLLSDLIAIGNPTRVIRLVRKEVD